jgi:two-component system cell cycle sensor histidine kinase/response regulator CckA
MVMENKDTPAVANKVRRRMEVRPRTIRDDPGTDRQSNAPEMQRLIQELQLRQFELERQNEELRRARSEIEEGVARYTRLQLQLADSQKMEAIGTLAGGIAHDFNNILAGILGELSVLDLELDGDDKSHACIQDMMELVTSGSELTKQLLALACRAPLEVKPLDLARVVAKTSMMFGRTRKEIEIRLDLPPGLLAVLIDRARMEQVLLNLFVNATQAMPQGGQLFLSAKNVELAESDVAPFGAAPGRYVRLDVKDTGVGMNAATQAHIFEPFFTTKGPGQGTGLGLASVYGVIKSHAGFISVESEIGKGTTFSVFLVATDLPTPSEKTPAAVIVRGSGTILLVDDEQHILRALTRLIETIGYDVLTASSGREAVEIVRRRGLGISLVILDMIMPDMSGSQTYDLLRKVAPGIKVLLSSGYSIEAQAQELLGRGCKGFIQKPYDVATLSAVLHRSLTDGDIQIPHRH